MGTLSGDAKGPWRAARRSHLPKVLQQPGQARGNFQFKAKLQVSFGKQHMDAGITARVICSDLLNTTVVKATLSSRACESRAVDFSGCHFREAWCDSGRVPRALRQNSMGTAGVAECVASPNLEFANLDYLHGSRTWLDRPAKEVSIRKGGEPLHF